MTSPSNYLREWRKLRGLTQQDLADKVGTNKSVISQLERSQRGLSTSWLFKIAPILGARPGQLVDSPPGQTDRTPVIRATAMPTHTNPYGGVFGGWIVSQMALGAGSEASRRVRGKAVLVAADELRFTGAPQVGDEVSVYVDLVESGRTSLTYAAEAVARERHGETETRVASGRFKFVALDDDDKPRSVTS